MDELKKIQNLFLGDPLPKLLKSFCFVEQVDRQSYKRNKFKGRILKHFSQ